MAPKRAAPMLDILTAWAPKASVPASKPRATKMGPSPALDRADAWFARVKKATAPAQLKKLAGELDKLDIDAMILEDSARWEQLVRDLTERRDDFGDKPSHQRLLQSMVDTLSST
jgi:hypothetical protein